MRSPRAKRPAEFRTRGVVWRQLALVFGMLVVLIAVPRVLPLLMPDFVIMAAIALTARVSTFLIGAAGVHAELAGNQIHLTNHILQIDPGCTAIVWLTLYAITVLAMPVSQSRKRQGLLLGWPILIAFNFARVVLVAMVSQWQPSQFALTHDVLMQSSFVVLTVGIWAVWVRMSWHDWRPGWY